MTSPETLGRQFEGATLYHGSYHPFSIGDIVIPQEEGERVFATSNLPYVKEYIGADIPGHVDKHGRKPRIFQVEGLGDEETHPEFDDTKVSRSGFRVVKELNL